ncbi:MAG: hypothetical protein FWE06_04545, partial [Oscillospiraceae bacterium]|nr:hypothetical protein [Oscillospiraceae bacterium]
SRLTEMDRYEDGVLLYAFLIDYSNVSMESYLYVWVNPNTGEPTAFEESSLYAKVPNILFPIPMRNGEIIPYDWFWIPQYGIVMTQYGFFDMSVMEIYKEQLRDAGFSQGSPEEDAAVSLESVWLYNVLDESPYGYYDSFDQLFVHIHSYADGEGFSITMFR